jgi:uncharacterized protein YfiM (DUF2279 family)
MRVRTRIGISVASAAVLAALSAGVAFADDQEITGHAADQARVAAVQAVPGKAGKVEKESNERAAYYGVLVTKPDALRSKYTSTRAATSWARKPPITADLKIS